MKLDYHWMKKAAGSVYVRSRASVTEPLYFWGGIDLSRPVTVRVLLTERCNYRCDSCDYWRRSHYPEEMAPEQWQAFFTELRQFSRRASVHFIGGEPTIYRGFAGLVEHCTALGLRWSLGTNGSTLSGLAAPLVAGRPLFIDVSMDGASAAVHDASRGVSGSFDKICDGVKKLRQARDEAERRFPIRIKYTVHRHNFHALPDMVRLLPELGATSVDFIPVRPWTSEVVDHLWLRDEDLVAMQPIVEELMAMKGQRAPIETEGVALRKLGMHFDEDEKVTPALAPCRAGMRDLFINPAGECSLCWFYPSIGTWRQGPLRAVWKSPAAAHQREVMQSCDRFGTSECATSCLSHRPLLHDVARGITWLRK
jgi:MoaA/NifB/PqqE/SkfB family radical SAM enzyme